MLIVEREQRFQELKGIMQEELDQSGIEGYGLGLIKTHFRGLRITTPCEMIY
jgi:hypothetical protein